MHIQKGRLFLFVIDSTAVEARAARETNVRFQWRGKMAVSLSA